MPVALVKLDVFLPEAASLKDRRQVLRSTKDRLRNDFNVSVAELNPDDQQVLWQRATLGICAVAADRHYLEGQLQLAANAALRHLAGQQVSVGPIEFLD